jgi:hypothetical protein
VDEGIGPRLAGQRALVQADAVDAAAAGRPGRGDGSRADGLVGQLPGGVDGVEAQGPGGGGGDDVNGLAAQGEASADVHAGGFVVDGLTLGSGEVVDPDTGRPVGPDDQRLGGIDRVDPDGRVVGAAAAGDGHRLDRRGGVAGGLNGPRRRQEGGEADEEGEDEEGADRPSVRRRQRLGA